MSGVFQNIDPPPPHPLARVCTTPPPPRLWCGERTHSLGGEGVRVNTLEDDRHCSVLYKCMYVLCGINHGIRIYRKKHAHGASVVISSTQISRQLTWTTLYLLREKKKDWETSFVGGRGRLEPNQTKSPWEEFLLSIYSHFTVETFSYVAFKLWKQ